MWVYLIKAVPSGNIQHFFQLTVAFDSNPKVSYYYVVAHNDGEFIPLTKINIWKRLLVSATADGSQHCKVNI